MKNPRYIIIDQNRGVFLGTYTDEDVGKDSNTETTDKRYALFASNNPFYITKACSFESENMAQSYIKDGFAPKRWEPRRCRYHQIWLWRPHIRYARWSL